MNLTPKEQAINYIINISNSQYLSINNPEFKFFKNDIDIIKEILKKKPKEFLNLDKKIQKNKELIFLAISNNNNFDIIKVIDKKILNDDDFMLKLIEIDPYFFEFSSISIRSNKDIVIKILQNKKLYDFSRICKHIAHPLTDDEDLCKKFVSNNYYCFTYFSENLQADEKIHQYLIDKNRFFLLEETHPNIKNNKDIILQILKLKHVNFNYISEELKDDKDIALHAILKEPSQYLYISDRLKNDEELLKIALQRNGGILEYAPENFKNNKQIVFLACKRNKSAIKHASEEIKKLCGKNNPVEILEKIINHDNLIKKLENKIDNLCNVQNLKKKKV